MPPQQPMRRPAARVVRSALRNREARVRRSATPQTSRRVAALRRVRRCAGRWCAGNKSGVGVPGGGNSEH
eukprot:363349-Chlamydomonas_euryale.AAC.3